MKTIFSVLVCSVLLMVCCTPATDLSSPSINGTDVVKIASTTAVINGTVTESGGNVITAKGVCWSTSPSPTIADSKTNEGAGAGSFTSSLTGLIPNTTYYVRFYVTSSSGTVYSKDHKFTTLAPLILPTVTTATLSGFTLTSAACGGNVTANGGVAVTARGVCWGIASDPTTANFKTTDGSDLGNFTSTLTGLTTNTTYYVRAYATSSSGTAYGSNVSFTLWLNRAGPQLTDIEGNIYNSVNIGVQTWMSSNLKVSRYNDNTSIPLVTDKTTWDKQVIPGYCWYNNDAANKTSYGALYNWYTVNTGKLCPTGWHVPTDPEWSGLIDFLGGIVAAGDKLKEAGTAHWLSPNPGATNESGFTALPGGRTGDILLNFGGMGSYGFWWSSTGDATGVSNIAKNWSLSWDRSNVGREDYYERMGYSVRCIKN